MFDERAMNPAVDKVKPNIRKLYIFIKTDNIFLFFLLNNRFINDKYNPIATLLL